MLHFDVAHSPRVDRGLVTRAGAGHVDGPAHRQGGVTGQRDPGIGADGAGPPHHHTLLAGPSRGQAVDSGLHGGPEVRSTVDGPAAVAGDPRTSGLGHVRVVGAGATVALSRGWRGRRWLTATSDWDQAPLLVRATGAVVLGDAGPVGGRPLPHVQRLAAEPVDEGHRTTTGVDDLPLLVVAVEVVPLPDLGPVGRVPLEHVEHHPAVAGGDPVVAGIGGDEPELLVVPVVRGVLDHPGTSGRGRTLHVDRLSAVHRDDLVPPVGIDRLGRRGSGCRYRDTAAEQERGGRRRQPPGGTRKTGHGRPLVRSPHPAAVRLDTAPPG